MRAVAQNTADPTDRAELEREAADREELAEMHEATADLYDREDDTGQE